MATEQKLSDVLSEFARTMVTDFPIQGILDHLVLRIVDVLPVSAAGVTLISPGSDPRYVAASDESALRFEKLQTEVGEGPCLAAYQTGEAIAVPDLRSEDRFPGFTPLALAAGLVAVFTFPLRQGDIRLGALDLYRDTPGPLDAEAMAAAQTLADVAAAYLTNAQARSDLREAADQYRQNALHDTLTGLPNRTLLGQRLDHAVLRARRSGKLMALLFIDVDRFKAVNDTLGHQAGDELLIGVAGRLKAILRPGDTLARLSGDEFVVLCEDLGDEAQVEPLAGRISAAMAEPFVLGGNEARATVSVGIAFAGPGHGVPDRLLRDADLAMYQAKQRGRGHHQVLDLSGHGSAHDRGTDLRDDLLCATERGGELRIDYQPVVATVDGRITGVEALLRWAHPVEGLLWPATVVPLAEQAGLMPEIGRWVLETACRDRHGWDRSHASDLQMTVNVSRRQLMAPAFAATIEEVLSDSGTAPTRLTLDLTEGLLVDDAERALVVLDGLKRLGVTLALDDFGTGYSSLGFLQRFPVDVVKIDRSLVAGLAHRPASSVVVSAVVDMTHLLGMTVVAEGVESAKQHVAVEALGCDSCQGFYFARPMPAAGIDSLLHLRPSGAGTRLPLPGAG